jgi:hypothetical protein
LDNKLWRRDEGDVTSRISGSFCKLRCHSTIGCHTFDGQLILWGIYCRDDR